MTYQDSVQTVEGSVDRGLFLYTLSTCVWCRKTKAFLKENDIAYKYVDVDLLTLEPKKEAMADMEKYNPQASFPTILVDNGSKVIVGFDEPELSKLI